MALTADLSTVTLQGTYVDLQGNPVAGSVTFTPTTIIKDEDQNQIIINSTVSATLNGSGAFSVVLPVTNDTDVVPQPFAYLVEEVFSGGRSFAITLPIGGANPENIADLAPAVSSSVATGYVTSDEFNALTGRYTSANATYEAIWDIDDNVTAAQTAATNASTALVDANKRSLNQFMLMGL